MPDAVITSLFDVVGAYAIFDASDSFFDCHRRDDLSRLFVDHA